jgi:hypothetical protein
VEASKNRVLLVDETSRSHKTEVKTLIIEIAPTCDGEGYLDLGGALARSMDCLQQRVRKASPLGESK